MTRPGGLDLIRRAALEVPVIIMTYLNPVMAFGLERFVREAAAAGASGLLLTDLPAGADHTVESLVAASPLALIRLIAPTTTPERLARAVQGATGFLYLISRLGVTGVRDQVPAIGGPLLLGGVRMADTRWTGQLAEILVLLTAAVLLRGGQVPLTKYSYLTQTALVALAGSLAVGVPATAIAIAGSALGADW